MACRMRSIRVPPSNPPSKHSNSRYGTPPGKDLCMIRSPLRLLAALILVALTLVVVACGGEDKGGGSGSTTQGAPTKGKKGGKLTQLGASDVDFLDPGITYYTAGIQVVDATQTGLYLPKPG